ncbi:MAG: transposase, partial [Myxococcales bacterium]|nr:transposase [Myxococcales bacterium]
YDALGDYVANSELIHADETLWPLLSKGSKKWWAWTFSSYDSEYICIDPSRGHQVPLQVLDGSNALLVVDAHGAYKKLVKLHPDLTLALCWSHARRKFIEAEAAYPRSSEAIAIMRKLFAIERMRNRSSSAFFAPSSERAERSTSIPANICSPPRQSRSRALAKFFSPTNSSDRSAKHSSATLERGGRARSYPRHGRSSRLIGADSFSRESR